MTQRDYHVVPRGQEISFYPQGVRIDAGERAVTEKPENSGGNRGKISGWTKASRRRMRAFLLIHSAKVGWDSYGATFTIPGDRCTPEGVLLPPPSVEECKNLWNHFSKNYVTRYGFGMVWRLELQKRRVAHWHCLIVAPGKDVGFLEMYGIRMTPEYWLHEWWKKSLEILGKHCIYQRLEMKIKHGPRKGRVEVEERIYQDVFHSQIQGVDKHSTKIEKDNGKGAWLRYIQDHSTKAKQEQEAGANWGRHWGVVGRDKFDHQQAYDSMKFSSEKTFGKFLRIYQRLCTPKNWDFIKARVKKTWPKFSGRVFGGRALGWRITRGRHGRSVWFTNPETVLNLARWAELEGGGQGGESHPSKCGSAATSQFSEWIGRRRSDGKPV